MELLNASENKPRKSQMYRKHQFDFKSIFKSLGHKLQAQTDNGIGG